MTIATSAIERANFAKVPVKAALRFSVQRHVAAASVRTKGLERRAATGLSPAVRSVASLLIPRWAPAASDIVRAPLMDGAEGAQTLSEFERTEIDIGALAVRLQAEGADAFFQSWRELMQAIDARSIALRQQATTTAKR